VSHLKRQHSNNFSKDQRKEGLTDESKGLGFGYKVPKMSVMEPVLEDDAREEVLKLLNSISSDT
jgi:hypothetical protein